jgi:hypothetical protein
MSSFWRVHAETVGLAAFAEGISLFSFPLPSSPATTLAHELDEEAMPFCDGGVFAGSEFIYIYLFILSQFCKNIWSVTNFAKIYICRHGPRRQGHNVVAHGGKSHQEWALSPNATGHGVTSLTPWPAALGA